MLYKLPLYFKCFFFNKENKKIASTYKIDSTDNDQYPLQLYKLSHERREGWQSLSIYAAAADSIGGLLKELFEEELSEEIYLSRTFVDPVTIMEKLHQGERSISIYDETDSEVFRMEYDIVPEELVQQKRKRLVRRPENR
jgi:hypothetical protein